jgi:hypothetical protein
VLSAAIVLLACATPRDPVVMAAGDAARSVLLLPLNVVVALPAELEGPSDRVWQALASYVEAHGKQVRTVRLGDARHMWLNAIQRVESDGRIAEGKFDVAAESLVQELGEHVEFDAVIMPSLFVQQARLSGKHAKWDGVSRRVEVDGDVLHVGSIITATSLAGATPGASLHVVVLGADGAKLHEAQAGLELLMCMKVEGEPGALLSERHIVWEFRPELFENPADVREGVTKALDPFLRPLPGDE